MPGYSSGQTHKKNSNIANPFSSTPNYADFNRNFIKEV